MIFVPEYSGVCSCRIGGWTSLKTSVWPSGDHDSAPIGRASPCNTTVSRPSASDRTMSSPPAGPPRPRPLPAAGVAAEAAAERINATRAPSGAGTMFDSIAGVVHTADAAPPSIGTRHRSPFFGTIKAPSLPQNAPINCEPAAGSSRGAGAVCAAAGASATYTFETPARSHTNTTWRPSGDHIGFDGWRMSISCSMVNGAVEADAARAGDADMNGRAMIIDTTSADASVTMSTGFITRPVEIPLFEHVVALLGFAAQTPGNQRDSFDRVSAHFLMEAA